MRPRVSCFSGLHQYFESRRRTERIHFGCLNSRRVVRKSCRRHLGFKSIKIQVPRYDVSRQGRIQEHGLFSMQNLVSRPVARRIQQGLLIEVIARFDIVFADAPSRSAPHFRYTACQANKFAVKLTTPCIGSARKLKLGGKCDSGSQRCN